MKHIFSLLFVFAVFFVGSSARAQVVSKAELDARMTYWASKLPFCKYQEGSFPSKDNCDDGDSVSLNGLTCAAGDGKDGIFGELAKQACLAVKNSQGKSGEWYRSPKKRYEIEHNLPTTDEKPSSNDSAQGVWAYIAQKKDVDAFRAWTGWMKNHKEGGILWPRYCKDKHCDFNVNDCPMLDRLAVYLKEGNPLCDLPPSIPADAPIKVLQTNLDGTVSNIYKLPGAHAFDGQIKALKAAINAALNEAIKLARNVDDAREKKLTLLRVIAHQADFITHIDAYVNKSGPARQDVAYGAYLLKKYGGFTTPDIDAAAKKVASKEKENAFFQYVAYGPSDTMLKQILFINGIQKCPPKGEKDHPRTSWIWETEDRQTEPGKAQPWVETMYWDCIFVGNLYNSGAIKGVNLPAPAGYVAATKEAEQSLQNAITGANSLLAALDKIRVRLQDVKHPPKPEEVVKLLIDAHDAAKQMLPEAVKPIAEVIPDLMKPQSWPKPLAPPTAKQVTDKAKEVKDKVEDAISHPENGPPRPF